MRTICLIFLGAFTVFGEPKAAPLAPPAGLIEAESDQNITKAKRIADPQASGGIYVTSERPYQPVFKAPVPREGDSFTIWVRHRGFPVQLKSIDIDGRTQIEHKWAWHSGPEFKWSNIGTYSRVTLGQHVFLIRGPGDNPGAGIDAVIASADPAFRPEGD